MKTLGVGLSRLIAFAGLTIGGIVAYIGDGPVSAICHWLKINCATRLKHYCPHLASVATAGKTPGGRSIRLGVIASARSALLPRSCAIPS